MIVTVHDEAVRGALTRLIAEHGFSPSLEGLAGDLGLSTQDVSNHLSRLAEAHALLLHPDSVRPWVVHPFALAPGSCWVRTPQRGYWANCLYCAFGIAAALRCDAVITTRYGGEDETVQYSIENGKITPSGDIFHFSTPPARWWDNVIFACSSFQPFKRQADIASWCSRHDLPEGGLMSVEALWRFASDWYGDCLQKPWRKRSPEEAKAVFDRHGLTGPFWAMD
jgi:hypothetical protein